MDRDTGTLCLIFFSGPNFFLSSLFYLDKYFVFFVHCLRKNMYIHNTFKFDLFHSRW